LQKDRHIPALDGLRGCAALLVVLSHFALIGFHPIVEAKLGNYGVMLFFALSGFLMGHLYLRRAIDSENTIHYIAARVSRIIPLYFLTIILSYVVYRFFDKNFVYPLELSQVMRLLTFNGSTQPFWSVGPEFQFYGVFILIWLLASYRGPSRRIILAAGVGLAVGIYLIAPVTPGILFPSKLHIFLLGIGAALLRPTVLRHGGHKTLIVAAQILSLVVLFLLVFPVGPTKTYLYPHATHDPKQNLYYLDLIKVALCSFVVLSFSINTRFALAIFGNRPMRLIGTYSFSIYLLHEVVLYELFRHTPIAALSTPLAILLSFGAIMMVSTASFYLFEEPSRIMMRRRIVQILESPSGDFVRHCGVLATRRLRLKRSTENG
jgi:peptidoglycan/LPS O-acetylase OafA/YrhL